jgi:hypothetical protein
VRRPSSSHLIEELRFASDSPLEGDGFEPSVPLWVLTVSGPPLVVYVTLPRFPFAENEIAFRDWGDRGFESCFLQR